MKILSTLIVILFLNILSSYAQAIDVVTGLNDPKRLYINGNDLYFSQPTEVFKIDITQSSPTPVSVVSGFASATGLAMDGTILYIAEFFEGRISRIDVSDPTATSEVFVSGLDTPNVLMISGDYLYYSDNNSDIVARIDLRSTDPVPEVIADFNFNFTPIGLAFDENILYMGQAGSGRVSKIDINNVTTPIDVVVGLNRPIGICLAGNKIFMAELNANKISTKDLSQGGNTATDFVTGLNGPTDVALSGSTLYIVEGAGNKISKVENALGINEVNLKNNITLFPNPTNDFIQISNINSSVPYTIYNIYGSKVANGIMKPNENISVEYLAAGVYIFKTEDSGAMKFVKN